MILDQLNGQWEKLFMVLLYKVQRRGKVTLSPRDFEALGAAFPDSIPVLFTHGHSDSVDFQIVDEASAARIAEYAKTQRGSA